MDYTSLGVRLGLCGLIFSSCVAQKAELPPPSNKTFFSCSLKPPELLTMSEQFLEWHKGYAIQVRDHERGIAVTDWVQENPSERHRVTLRTMVAPQGSLVSAHTEVQWLENQDWIEQPSSSSLEVGLLSELKNYIRNSPALKPLKVSVYD